jgi:hypothetical protein
LVLACRPTLLPYRAAVLPNPAGWDWGLHRTLVL